jgi:hypothetical protein
MHIDQIVADLRAERDRIDQAITALDGTERRRGRRRISAAGRKRISEAMKKRWAARKKSSKSATAA